MVKGSTVKTRTEKVPAAIIGDLNKSYRHLQLFEFRHLKEFVATFCLFLFGGFLQDCANPPAESGIIHAVVFHEVSPTHLHGPCVSPDYFHDILQIIKNSGKPTVFASEILSAHRERFIPSTGMIALTFDDGWSGTCDFADPLLRDYGMRASFFVSTDSIDQGRPRYCQWDDLRFLKNSGRWEIQSHSVTHPDFKEIDAISLRNEMVVSLARLREQGFSQFASIAYPFGHCDKRIENMARKCGYEAGFIAGGNGRIEVGSDRFAFPRTTICQVFNQELVCRKMGLDVSVVRRELAIYDEVEGAWNEHWTLVNSDPSIPRGLYGKTYLRANHPESCWSIDRSIEEAGRYGFSLWTPSEIENGSVEVQETGFWKIQRKDGLILDQGMIPPRKKNGWTLLKALNCARETIEFVLIPNSDTCNTFIVDAVKIERLSDL